MEIPAYFLCPISLELMRDPVALPTGITFERTSIQRWLSCHSSCPVTKQPLLSPDLTPNHTLARLIQSWHAANAPVGDVRVLAPALPFDQSIISRLLQETDCLASVRQLRSIIASGEAGRCCVLESRSPEFLASVVEESPQTYACDEALVALHSLRLSDRRLLVLLASNKGFPASLFAAMRLSSYASRAYAALLLRSAIPLVPPAELMRFANHDNLHEIVGIIADRTSVRATNAALRILIEIVSRGGSRVKAVHAGAVYSLLDLLLDDTGKRTCELALAALSKLCSCAEGRAELVGHAAGVAVVSKKILRVSALASETAMRIVEKVAKLSATSEVLREMLRVGAVSKLCVLLQADCEAKTKEKAREILRLHARTWNKSPCLSSHFLSSYPAS